MFAEYFELLHFLHSRKKKGTGSIHESLMMFYSLKLGENIVWKLCFLCTDISEWFYHN